MPSHTLHGHALTIAECLEKYGHTVVFLPAGYDFAPSGV